MTMTTEQIQKFVMTYLETTECQIIEKSPSHVTVKLSPQADRDLTNRPYYWGFIERTGAEPETMSFSFIFDPERHQADLDRQTKAESERTSRIAAEGEASNPIETPVNAQPQEDSILGRYFGVVRPLPILGPGRIQREELTYGSPRLKQIFAAAQRSGRCVYLFEDPGQKQRMTLLPAAYEPWLGVCFKVELSCDVKREELHFYGISLLNGKVDEDFNSKLLDKNWMPRVPENIHIEPSRLSLADGRDVLESKLRTKVESYDHSWAEEASERLQDELTLIESYYRDLLEQPDEEQNKAIQEQFESRQGEIRWQYQPRIVVSTVNYGIFHLRSPW
ncbi:hypothetical protein J2T12_000076 [Paenibacillus anaericanus]|uniref:YqhG family protein n=1 Tax=Paenibacillus TaxID=44249 RepID=UPI0027864359|nr:YqhG family protein [Paenibacillus anaericanus]MDQ0086682.1 hypothetical protein [Paenibacillus anaericanus]